MTERKPTLEIGDSVGYSAEGLRTLSPRFPDRVGTIESLIPQPPHAARLGFCVAVCWPGRKTTDVYHESFLKKRQPVQGGDQ